MQLDDCYNYPVGFPTPPAAHYFAPKTKQDIVQKETASGCLNLAHAHQTSRIRSVTHGVTFLEKTFTKCLSKLADKIFSLTEANKNLRQQIVTAQLHEDRMTRLHEERIATLNTHISLLTKQMDQLIAEQATTIQALQTRLLEAPAATKTTAFGLANQEWEKEQAKLIAENQAIQNQINSLQVHIKAVSDQCQALNCKLSEEPKRERQAIHDRLYYMAKAMHVRLDQDIKGAEKPGYFKDAVHAYTWVQNYYVTIYMQ